MIRVADTAKLVLAWSVLACVGCSGGGTGGPRLETVPVEGEVTLDGEAFGPGSLAFVSTAPPDTEYHNGAGVVSGGGSFTAGTYEEDDGLVPGDYEVRLIPSSEDPSVTTVATQPLVVTIPEDGDTALKIDLVTGEADPAAGLLSSRLESRDDSTSISAGSTP